MSVEQAEGVRVLVVEDDREMCERLCAGLSSRGYQAEGVAGGRESLARLQHENFAAVIVDLRLTRVQGFDLVREIQGLAEFRPWVMYTGVPEPGPRNWGQPQGVFCVLMKGTPARELVWSVEEACRGASQVHRARCV